ncbi:MAG: hypothetical protein RLY22_872, partial [Actinomycetota bacterium]
KRHKSLTFASGEYHSKNSACCHILDSSRKVENEVNIDQ